MAQIYTGCKAIMLGNVELDFFELKKMLTKILDDEGQVSGTCGEYRGWSFNEETIHLYAKDDGSDAGIQENMVEHVATLLGGKVGRDIMMEE